MKRMSAVSAILACVILNGYAANEVITNFKDPSITCDYLIVAAKDFAGPAVSLAQHRNSFKYDGVENAKVAYLEDILVAFPGTDYNHRNVALWKALKWAKENWKLPFRYIVLVGFDAYCWDATDSTVSGCGLMPTWYEQEKVMGPIVIKNFPVRVTDDWYTNLSSADPPADFRSGRGDSSISIGRIPALTTLQCSLYIEKVKQFDLSRPKGPWRNNVLAIADDAMQGMKLDQLGSAHQDAAEVIVNNQMQGFMARKRYLSAFPLDEFYEKPTAKNAIFQTINQGISWTFFFGHGTDQTLTDEYVLTTESSDRFVNDSMPFVFLSFSCANGSFLPGIPASMCLKFLFTPKGGTIAYIASPYESYASDNEKLGSLFFSELKKTPHSSVGSILARAKTLANDENSISYYLLGDPALRVSTGSIDVKVKPYPDSVPSAVTISLPGVFSQTHYSVAFTVRDSIFPAPVLNPPYAGSPPNLAYSCDSAIATMSGVFSDSITVPLPQSYQKPLKAIVYVWNDTADGHAELTIGAGAQNPVALMPAKKEILRKPTLSKIRGSLVVANLEPGIHQIRIFDIRGRIVYCSDAAASTGSMTISLIGKNLSSGRYILQVRSKAAETNLPFVHVAGD